MSEEIALAAFDAALFERLTKERDALALQLDATRRDLAAVEAAYEARAIEAFELGRQNATLRRQCAAYRADRDLAIGCEAGKARDWARLWKRVAARNHTQFRRVLRLWSGLLLKDVRYRELLEAVYAGRAGYLAPDLVERIRATLYDAPVASPAGSGEAEDAERTNGAGEERAK